MQDEIERERETVREREIERLREDCAEAYQIIGVLWAREDDRREGNPPADLIPAADFERALDNLSAAAAGGPRPHADLLPWPSR